jgi:hypothetical protein
MLRAHWKIAMFYGQLMRAFIPTLPCSMLLSAMLPLVDISVVQSFPGSKNPSAQASWFLLYPLTYFEQHVDFHHGYRKWFRSIFDHSKGKVKFTEQTVQEYRSLTRTCIALYFSIEPLIVPTTIKSTNINALVTPMEFPLYPLLWSLMDSFTQLPSYFSTI